MIEVLATGFGLTPDLAALDALRRAVDSQARVMVESRTVVRNQTLFEQVIVSRSKAYVTRYEIRGSSKLGNKVAVRVVAQINEGELSKALREASSHPAPGPLLAAQMEALAREKHDRERRELEDRTTDSQFFAEPIVRDLLAPLAVYGLRPHPDGGLEVDLGVPRIPRALYESKGGPELVVGVTLRDAAGRVIFRDLHEVPFIQWGYCFEQGIPFMRWQVRVRPDPETVAKARRADASWN